MKTIKILLSILVILSGAGFTSAATLNVGSGQTYATVQSAVDAAETGDVIMVGEGTYPENIYVRKDGILLMGKNKERTIIDAKKVASGIRIQANNVTVSGFTIQNNGGSGREDAGITIYSGSSNTIANLLLVNNNVGISIYSSSNYNIVSGNNIQSSGRYGIYVYSSTDNKIYNNNIQNNKIGVYVDSARITLIYSNNFIDNKDQAYDNSGQSSWDEEKSGNYWSNYKGSGAYPILGGANAKDNYPLSKAVAIKEVTITPPSGKGQGAQGDGKKSPGFAGIVVLFSLITIAALINRKR